MILIAFESNDVEGIACVCVCVLNFWIESWLKLIPNEMNINEYKFVELKTRRKNLHMKTNRVIITGKQISSRTKHQIREKEYRNSVYRLQSSIHRRNWIQISPLHCKITHVFYHLFNYIKLLMNNLFRGRASTIQGKIQLSL